MRTKFVIGYGKRYLVGTDGSVVSCGYRNTNIRKPLTPRISSTGYWVVDLSKNSKTYQTKVHRLVAMAFIKNHKNKPLVNHKNGNKLDNSICNLEWVTHSENIRHAFDVLGMTPGWFGKKGSQHCRSVEVYKCTMNGKIIRKYAGLAEAERETGIGKQNISKVIRGLRNHAGGHRWRYA
jgi:hypothetical protein